MAKRGHLVEGTDFTLSDGGSRARPRTAIAKEAFRGLREQVNRYAVAAKDFGRGLPVVSQGPTDALLNETDRKRVATIGRELPEEIRTKKATIDLRLEKSVLQSAGTVRATASHSVSLAQALLSVREKLRRAKRREGLSTPVKVTLGVGAGAAALWVLSRVA